jgi:hypothetical protein
MGYKIGVTLFFIAFLLWAMNHANNERIRKENGRE